MKTNPDYGVSPTQLPAPNIDNAELAARLGIDRLRRDGRVIYYDTCDYMQPWQKVTGLDGSAAVDNTFSYEGPNSIKLIPESGGSRAAEVYKTFPWLGTHKLGIEVMHGGFDNSGNRDFNVYLEVIPESTVKYNFQIQFLYYTNVTIKYLNSSNVLTTLDTVARSYASPIFRNIKLVVNLTNFCYERLYYDDLAYTLGAGYPCYQSAVSQEAYVRLRLRSHDSTATMTPAWIDNVILTIDEA